MDFLKKNILLILLFITSLIITIHLYTISYTNEEKPTIRPDTQEVSQHSNVSEEIAKKNEESIQYRIQNNLQERTSQLPESSPPPSLPSEAVPTIGQSTEPQDTPDPTLLSVTLTVPSLGYQETIELPRGSTTYDLMQALSTRGLSFEEDNYGELGSFITKIGALSNDYKQRKFWIYSVNGSKATIGVSHYILTPHDIISWHYEQETL